MSKYIGPILIGLAAGVVTAIILGALIGGGWITTYCAAFIGVITAYLLANLAGNRKVAKASDADRARALTFEAPADKALLYIYREGFVGMAAGLNIAVDARDIAQLKSPRFTCVALSPGPHKVTAAFGGLAGPQNKPASFDVDAVAGGVTALRVGISMGLLQNGIAFTPQTDLEAAK